MLDRLLVASLPLVPAPVIRRVASRYVAGETLDQALDTVARLNGEGACATLDVLGEGVADRQGTSFFVDEYRRAIREIDRRKLDCNVSVKLSAMGLAIDPELAYANFGQVAAEAASFSNFVRIDMEDSSLTQATLDLFQRARRERDNVGIVLQAYLRRTQGDVARAIAERWSVRICKGIYVEPREIAFESPDLIRRNFAYLTDRMIAARIPVGIATHDEAMILEALHSIGRHGADPGDYEFQMLLGVGTALRRSLIASGHRLRVYVPYGTAWKAYSMRRLKENPAIARYVLAGLFRRN
jgi:proline dehydrogenase